MTWVLDLDGVIWLGEQRLHGAAEAVAALRAAGEQVLFATNNSASAIADQEAKLAQMGIPATGDVMSSAQAAAALVQAGERVFVCGGPGITEAILARGAHPTTDVGKGEAGVDVVVVGFDRDFDYERIRLATQAIFQGARFVATNDDPTFPTPDGLIPGGGAIAAAIAYAAGVEPEIAGKPHVPMAELIRARGGDQGIMVGDRPATDGLFAKNLGYRFGLVLSGVTGPDDLPVEPTPDFVATDLQHLVETVLGAR